MVSQLTGTISGSVKLVKSTAQRVIIVDVLQQFVPMVERLGISSICYHLIARLDERLEVFCSENGYRFACRVLQP